MTLRRYLCILTLGATAWTLLRLAGASAELTAVLIIPLVVAAWAGERDEQGGGRR